MATALLACAVFKASFVAAFLLGIVSVCPCFLGHFCLALRKVVSLVLPSFLFLLLAQVMLSGVVEMHFCK